jgi:hypothetical protein
LEQAIRERHLPFLTERLLLECGTFVHADTNPTPRAQDGCHDDTVMAAAIALEMYRLRGAHPEMEAEAAVAAEEAVASDDVSVAGGGPGQRDAEFNDPRPV